SGEAVGRLWRWHKLAWEDVLVVSDDIDRPFGKLRLRERGSAGGHNGLKSIFTHLRSQDIARLKIGVGRPDQREARDYVLSPFTPSEREELPIVIAHAADAVELALREGIVAAMNTMNGNQPSAVSGQRSAVSPTAEKLIADR
ncbi:MAG: aminoacyl-tRNA hydrolase, partial [Chloroflexota bacterium]|nr:aminoacyl-tRNA hydrolase [Chloroflexota bacterium]